MKRVSDEDRERLNEYEALCRRAEGAYQRRDVRKVEMVSFSTKLAKRVSDEQVGEIIANAGLDEGSWTPRITEAMARDLQDAREVLNEYEALFELQHRRVDEATAYWQEITGQPGVIPDLGRLVNWLLHEVKTEHQAACIESEEVDTRGKQIEVLERRITKLEERIYQAKIDAYNQAMRECMKVADKQRATLAHMNVGFRCRDSIKKLRDSEAESRAKLARDCRYPDCSCERPNECE